MTKYETITPKDLKKILDLSTALELGLLCTITDTIIKIRIYGSWNIKKYTCSENNTRKIFDMLNNHYQLLNK